MKYILSVCVWQRGSPTEQVEDKTRGNEKYSCNSYKNRVQRNKLQGVQFHHKWATVYIFALSQKANLMSETLIKVWYVYEKRQFILRIVVKAFVVCV